MSADARCGNFAAPTVTLTTALMLALLGGCVFPPQSAPQLELLKADDIGLGAQAAPQIDARWWHQYGDRQFDELIESALARNPTLQEALARVGVARAQVQAAAAGRRPEVNLQGEAERQRFPERFIYPPPYGGGSYWQGAVFANLSWELDFWGHQAALLDNAQSSAAAAVLDASAARLAIAGSVAQTYLELNRAYALAEIATQSAEQRRQILEITRKRIAAGLDTNVELREAEAAVPQAELAKLQAAAAADLAIHRLAALAGKGAQAYRLFQKPTLDVAASFAVPEELPLDLLGRRPDVLAVRARIAAATARRHAARAAFFPNINLQAFAGFQAIGLDNLLQAADRTYGAGPAISLPLFDSLRRKSALYSAVASEDAAIATYNDTVLRAVQQVADQLSLVRSAAKQLEQARATLAATEAAYRLAQRRYQAGLANYLSVLITETQVLSARTSYVEVVHAQAIARMTLLLAVGGSFSPPA